MNDFAYYNPVRVHFGKDALKKLDGELAAFGKKVLLAYGGGSIKRTGLYATVMNILQGAGKEVFELSGVMPNPRTEKVYEGIQICKENGVDLILAVGGGSVIDCVKAISVGARTDRDFWQAFFKNNEPAKGAVPFGVVLTIPATGSELDKSAVITNWATSEKNCYENDWEFPQFSILDPTLTYSLPQKQMVNGIVDTMSHIMELYVSPPDEECLTDRLAEAALLTEIEAARIAMKDPKDYQARANLMWTSSFALCGMLNNGKSGDWAGHNIEHPISAVYDVAHGAGLAVVHPAYLEYICPKGTPRLARLAVRVWDVDAAGKTEEDVALEGIRRLRSFFKDELGAPSTLRELGIANPDFEKLADLTDLSCWSYLRLTREDILSILHRVA